MAFASFIAIITLDFTSAMALLLNFIWPGLRLYVYLGLFAFIISFTGYFSSTHPVASDKTPSAVFEFFLLLFLSKGYFYCTGVVFQLKANGL